MQMRMHAFFGAFLVLAGGCYGDLSLAPPSQANEADAAGPVSYRPQVQELLERTGCTGVADCHGLASVPMYVRSSPSTDADWERNYEEVKLVSDSPTSALLLIKPIGAAGHLAVLDSNSATIALWRAWIEQGHPF